MRNIETREGYEFWDKICAVQSYAFLLSPDGRRVVKTPNIGDWIDKHEAQMIVDHAQEDFNELKEQHVVAQSELAALREELARYQSGHEALYDRLSATEQRNAENAAALQLATRLLASGLSALNPRAGLSKNVRAFLESQRKPTESGASE